MATFAFDFSKMAPWWGNFGDYMSTIMESKATEARQQPFRTEESWRTWWHKTRDAEKRAAAESKERLAASRAARLLNERLYADARKREEQAYMRRQMEATGRAARGLPATMDSAYGGSSPGGVEGAKLSASTIPQPAFVPFAPPAYGPVKDVAPSTTVNVSGGGGSASYGGGYTYGGGGGGGGGSSLSIPSYWNTETSGGFNADDAEKQNSYGPWRRRW